MMDLIKVTVYLMYFKLTQSLLKNSQMVTKI